MAGDREEKETEGNPPCSDKLCLGLINSIRKFPEVSFISSSLDKQQAVSLVENKVQNSVFLLCAASLISVQFFQP